MVTGLPNVTQAGPITPQAPGVGQPQGANVPAFQGLQAPPTTTVHFSGKSSGNAELSEDERTVLAEMDRQNKALEQDAGAILKPFYWASRRYFTEATVEDALEAKMDKTAAREVLQGMVKKGLVRPMGCAKIDDYGSVPAYWLTKAGQAAMNAPRAEGR